MEVEQLEHVQIQMLGDFSLRTQTQQISDSDNRTRKVWLLLAFLIYNRYRTVSPDELMDLLWNESQRGSNPGGALKTTFHRVRASLNALWPSAGHELIIRRDGGYSWNSEVPITLDIDVFESLRHAQSDDEDAQLQIYLDALELYQGNFLDKMSAEPWVIPISVYYHNLYIQVLLKALPLLMARQRQSEVVELCRAASEIEPCDETIHYYLMQALLDLGDAESAANVYKELSERLLSSFGIIPPENLRSLYRQATRSANTHIMDIEAIAEQLREPTALPGALMCEFDFFIVLCRSVARSMSRTGIATHIALLSVTGDDGGMLSKRSLPGIMDKLDEEVRTSLRRGDAASRCSGSQYVLMLPQANYENSCMICTRIIKNFTRKYPHSPARFQYTIYPLNPNL